MECLKLMNGQKKFNKIIEKCTGKNLTNLLKFTTFLSAKYGNYKVLHMTCITLQSKLDKKETEKILHFTTLEEEIEMIPLNYCYQRNNRKTTIDLLLLERDLHKKSKDGVQFLREHVTPGPIRDWIFFTFPKTYEVKKPRFAWVGGLFSLFLTYMSVIYNFVSDYKLWKEYGNYNNSNNILNDTRYHLLNDTRHHYDDLYKPEHIKDTYAYASNISLACLITSVIVYFGSILLAETPNITTEIRAKFTCCNTDEGNSRCKHYVCNIMTMYLKIFLWPFVHIWYKLKYSKTKNYCYKEKKTEQELDSAWNRYKMYEKGCENTLQLCVMVWVARHYIFDLTKMDISVFLREAFYGILATFNLGKVDKNHVITLTLGKLLVSFVSIAFSTAKRKNKKRTLRSIFLFISYLIQLYTRLLAFLCVIFINSRDNWGEMKYIFSILVHWAVSSLIFLMFERDRNNIKEILNQWTNVFSCTDKESSEVFKGFKKIVTLMSNLILRIVSSFIFIPGDVSQTRVQYTFISRSLGQLLYLAENLTAVLLLYLLPDNYPQEIVERFRSIKLVYAVVGGWLISVMLQVNNISNFSINTIIIGLCCCRKLQVI